MDCLNASSQREGDVEKLALLRVLGSVCSLTGDVDLLNQVAELKAAKMISLGLLVTGTSTINVSAEDEGGDD